MAYGQISQPDIAASNLELQKDAFSRNGARLWDEMPRSLRELPKTFFKAKIKIELVSLLDKENAFLQIQEIFHIINWNLLSNWNQCLLSVFSLDFIIVVLIYRKDNNINYIFNLKLIRLLLLFNGPFPSSLVPLFQSESMWETLLMKMTLIWMKMKLHAELIFIRNVLHLDSFWHRGTRELGNGLFYQLPLLIYKMLGVPNRWKPIIDIIDIYQYNRY